MRFNPDQPGKCSRFNNDAFVWIPKNASTTLRFLFPDGDASFHDFDVETYWVILRDPILRWKSGVMEYIMKPVTDNLRVMADVENPNVPGDGIYTFVAEEEDLKRVDQRLEWVLDHIDQIEFDPHTAPRTSFLQYTGDTRYIDISKKFWAHKLINELGLPHKPGFGSTIKTNTTGGHIYKEERMHSINSVMSPIFENRLREYYSEDFKLIEQVL